MFASPVWDNPRMASEPEPTEIVADYRQHVAGEREVVDWTRPDGRRYANVPVVYVREVSKADYLARFPHVQLPDERCYFWEVSVD